MGEPQENLFISGLPYGTDDAKLQAVLGPYGTISSCRVLPAQEGKKGAAMVRFAQVSEAQWLVENMNGNMPQGFSESIWVNYAKPKEDAGKGGGKGGGSWGGGGSSWGSSGSSWSSSGIVLPGDKGKGKGKDKGKGKGKDDKGKGKGKDKGGKGKGPPADDACKVFVGGLPKSATEESISAYFSSVCGPVVKVDIKYDQETWQSRGFGFVTFQDAGTAAATCELGGHQIDGKSVEVKPSGSPPNGGKDGGKGGKDSWGGGKGGGGGGGGSDNKIFVGALNKSFGEEEIQAYFSGFGAVNQVMLKRDEEGNSKGFCFVTFADASAVQAVLANYNDNLIQGKWVDVKEATPQAKGDDKGKGKGKDDKGKGKSKGWAPY